MLRNVPRHFLLTLMSWYNKAFTVVRWESCFSHQVKLTAGVRQGGVLSPLLFAVFVDDLLVKLRNSSLGCYIKGICLNAAMFADDLLLLSISVCDLQRMVNVWLM